MFPTEPTKVTQVAADLGAGDQAIDAQVERNKKLNMMIKQVQERAAMGAQLAGRGFAQ